MIEHFIAYLQTICLICPMTTTITERLKYQHFHSALNFDLSTNIFSLQIGHGWPHASSWSVITQGDKTEDPTRRKTENTKKHQHGTEWPQLTWHNMDIKETEQDAPFKTVFHTWTLTKNEFWLTLRVPNFKWAQCVLGVQRPKGTQMSSITETKNFNDNLLWICVFEECSLNSFYEVGI